MHSGCTLELIGSYNDTWIDYTRPTGGSSMELIMMVAGVGGVVVLLGLMAKRRK